MAGTTRMGAALLAAAAVALGASTPVALAAPPSDTVWLCKPGQPPDPCGGSFATTYYEPLPTRTDNPAPRKSEPKIDCFYVYPTVSGQTGSNADLTVDPEQSAIAKYQASRFSRSCRVYAPMYRQLTLDSISSQPAGLDKAARLAYSDVRSAWRDYLAHYNHGRGVVLIGHSQGSAMLRVLTREEIDPKPRVRKLLVSAILLGGNVTVQKGRDIGGDFSHIRACHSPAQIHCVIAYSTFNETPPPDTRFGRNTLRFANVFGLPSDPNLEVLCTNPAALGGGTGSLQTLVRSELFPGRIGLGLVILYGGVLPLATTPWVDPPGTYEGTCANAGGANVLMISDEAGALPLHSSPDATWGLHLADINIALGNLVAIVDAQAAAYRRVGPTDR